MAIGLSPKYSEDLLLDGVSTAHFIAFAVDAAKQLGWEVGYINNTGFLAYTRFSWRSASEEVKVTVVGDVATVKSECTGSQMVDWGKNKENVQALIAEYNNKKASLSADEIEQKVYDINTSMAFNGTDEHIDPPSPSAKEKLTSFFAIFIPTKGYFITPVIINLNILIFILMVLNGVNFMLPDTESLIRWGANFKPITLQGEWWRLFTACYIHIGIIHLLMNLYALLYIGLLLEQHLGKIRFLAAYVLTGIVASVVSLWWHDYTVSAGASGAVFGMYGVFLAMLTTNLIEKAARKSLLTSIGVFVIYNLMNGMKGGVDNAAHIGGLIGGLIVGYIYFPGLKNAASLKLKYGTVVLVTVLVLASSFTVVNKLPNDMAIYEKELERFSSLESMALEVYSMPGSVTREQALYEIKDRGIYYWNESVKLLREVDKLNIPDILHTRNKILMTYCDLRIKSYNLLYKTVEEDTDKYKDSIDEYDQQIQVTINSLSAL